MGKPEGIAPARLSKGVQPLASGGHASFHSMRERRCYCGHSSRLEGAWSRREFAPVNHRKLPWLGRLLDGIAGSILLGFAVLVLAGNLGQEFSGSLYSATTDVEAGALSHSSLGSESFWSGSKSGG